jgi:AcrR family transcriptional regulator
MPSTATGARRTQEERRAEAERALLDAATRSFARKGMAASSLADIGAEAGFSRALVNHHFGSRAALVDRLAARNQRRFLSELEAAGRDPDEDDLGALLRIAAAYLNAAQRHTEDMRAFLVMWGSAFATEAQLRPVFAEDDERFRRGVSAVVRSGQRAGAVRADADADSFAVVFVAIVRGIAGQYLVSPDAVDLAAAGATCAHLVRCHLSPVTQESS